MTEMKIENKAKNLTLSFAEKLCLNVRAITVNDLNCHTMKTFLLTLSTNRGAKNRLQCARMTKREDSPPIVSDNDTKTEWRVPTDEAALSTSSNGRLSTVYLQRKTLSIRLKVIYVSRFTDDPAKVTLVSLISTATRTR